MRNPKGGLQQRSEICGMDRTGLVGLWHVRPLFIFKKAAASLWVPSAPLLKEKRDALAPTAVA